MRRSIATVGLVVFSLLAASGVGAAQSYSGSADSSMTASSTTDAQVQDDERSTTQSEEDSEAGSSAEVDGSASAEISTDGETEQALREELDGLLNATQRLELEQSAEEDDQQDEESSTQDEEEHEADEETEENASSDGEIRSVSSGNGTIDANGSSSHDGYAEANGSAEERDRRELDEPNRTDEDEPEDGQQDEEQDRNLSEQVEIREDESTEEEDTVKASSTMDALVEFRQNEPQIEHQAEFEPALFEQDVEQVLHHEEQLGTQGGLSLNLGMSSAFSATSNGVQDSMTRVQGTVDRVVASLNGLVGASASSSTEASGQATSAVADDVAGDLDVASGGDGKVKTKVESTVERVQTPEVEQPEPKVDSESSVQSKTEVSSSATGSGGLDI